MKKVWVMMLATLMVSTTMMAGNVKKSTTLPIVGEVVKARSEEHTSELQSRI